MKVLCKKRWTPNYPRDIYSNTKSLTSVAVGIACHDSMLQLDTKLGEVIKDREIRDFRINDITLENMLTMSSGFDIPYLMYFVAEKAKEQMIIWLICLIRQ